MKVAGVVFFKALVGAEEDSEREYRETQEGVFMSSKVKAYVFLLSYTAIMGLSFLFAKIALPQTAPMTLLAHRFLIAFVSILPVAVYKREELNLSVKMIRDIFPLSLVTPVLFFLFQLYGLSRVASAEAGVIQATVPIFTLILSSLMLKEQISFWQKIFTLISVLGAVFIFFVDGKTVSGDHIAGLFLIALSCLAISYGTIMMKKITKKYSILQFMFVNIGVGFFVFNTLALGHLFLQGNIAGYFEPFMSRSYLFSLLYLGFLSTFVTFFLLNFSLQHIAASKVGVFSNLATVITVAAGVLILKEDVSWLKIVGIVAIIGGVYGTNASTVKSIKEAA